MPRSSIHLLAPASYMKQLYCTCVVQLENQADTRERIRGVVFFCALSRVGLISRKKVRNTIQHHVTHHQPYLSATPGRSSRCGFSFRHCGSGEETVKNHGQIDLMRIHELRFPGPRGCASCALSLPLTGLQDTTPKLAQNEKSFMTRRWEMMSP